MRKSPTPAGPIAVAAADGVLDAVFALVWFVTFVSLVAVGIGTLVIGVGAFVLAFAVFGTVWYADVERRRAAGVYGVDLHEQPRRLARRTGWRRPLEQAWLDLRDPFLLRTMGHHLATGLLGLMTLSVLTYLVGGGIAEIASAFLPAGDATVGGLGLIRYPAAVAVVVGAIYLGIAAGVLTGCYHLHRVLSRALLAGDATAALRHQLEQAAAQRDGAVRTVETDRRRIERDLHDGVQPQLVNVGMLLSMAQHKLDTDPEGARALLAEAHTGTKTAIHDLRQLGRGIHPSVLTDSGLDAALSALLAQFAIPTTLEVDLPHRLGTEVESALYFTVAEALANAAKHSGATACVVRLRSTDGAAPTAVAEIVDNGRGGATATPGGGLAGLADRLRAVGGFLDVRSGAQGTTVTATVPTGRRP